RRYPAEYAQDLPAVEGHKDRVCLERQLRAHADPNSAYGALIRQGLLLTRRQRAWGYNDPSAREDPRRGCCGPCRALRYLGVVAEPSVPRRQGISRAAHCARCLVVRIARPAGHLGAG